MSNSTPIVSQQPEDTRQLVITDLRNSLAWMDLVLATLREGVLVVDENNKIIFANDAVATMLNKNRIFLLGAYPWDVLPISQNGNPCTKASYKTAINTKQIEALSGAYILTKHIPLFVWVDFAYIPKIKQYVIVVQDETQSKHAEDERVKLIREQVARSEAENAQKQLSFLADASKILTSSLDYETTLNNLSDIFVPQLADWCVVHILEQDNTIRRLATRYKDPKNAPLAKALETYYDRTSTTTVSAHFKSLWQKKKPVITTHIDDAWFQRAGRDPMHVSLLKRLAPTSHIFIPILIGNTLVGTISLMRMTTHEPYTKANAALAVELTHRASLAVLNAKLYQASQMEIVERKRTEERLNAQYIVTKALAESSTLNEAVPTILGTLCQCLGWDWGGLWNINSTEDTLYLGQYWQRHPKETHNFTQISKTIVLKKGQGLPGRVWKKGTYIFVSDIAKDPNYPRRDAAEKNGFHAAISFPIIHKNTVMGVLDFFSTTFAPPEQEIITMIGSIGIQIGQFIERISIEQRKDDYISIASHELKTPVTSIKAFTQILIAQSKKSNEIKNLPYFTRMDKQLDRLSDLVNDLLDVSKIQSGKLAIREEVFAIAELVHQTVTDMKTLHSTHTLSITGSTSKTVCADKDRIQQVLTNLLENAIKYSPTAKKVLVTMKDREAEVIISVTDYGIGITPENQEKIFDRFYRVKETNNTYQGQGLGLYIVSEIIKRHDGKIMIKSLPGKGSTFSFSLPTYP